MLPCFFFAGFECATGTNAHGRWIDQIAATQHDRFAEADYRRLREVGIGAAREGVRWPLVDRVGRYDFASVAPFLAAARAQRIELVWDLFHFGYPDDADPFAAGFADRFADYCYALARHVVRESAGPWWFTPVNEPSYFAWAAGDAGLFAPHAHGRGYELKCQLARAAILAIDAIRDACPEAGIVNVDSVCRVVAPLDRPDLEEQAEGFNRDVVFQSLDMLCGRIEPSLHGTPAHLGTIGINYYWTNQWEFGRAGVPLAPDDPRLRPVGELVKDVWKRYGTDVLITETGHRDEWRAEWLRHVAREADEVCREGVPLRGICLYPILGMPEWHARDEWTRMGLWDLERDGDVLLRRCHEPMRQALREVQAIESLQGRRDAA